MTNPHIASWTSSKNKWSVHCENKYGSRTHCFWLNVISVLSWNQVCRWFFFLSAMPTVIVWACCQAETKCESMYTKNNGQCLNECPGGRHKAKKRLILGPRRERPATGRAGSRSLHPWPCYTLATCSPYASERSSESSFALGIQFSGFVGHEAFAKKRLKDGLTRCYMLATRLLHV